MENSLDAGADSISIDVSESGISFIQVSDNGSGMDREDAELCITRHSTSKIKDAGDLFNIHTLGFRGEALASISSVSKTTIVTRTKEEIKGTEIVAQAGKILSNKPIGAKQGTTITVEDLFFNTPARKKHMKDMETEFRQIADVVMRYALANPQVHFVLKHDGKEVLNCPATSDTLNNITSLYGKDVAKNLLPVNYAKDNILIMGFISKPSYSRSDRSYQSLFVNNRYIQNKTITQAIYDALHTLLFINRHPLAILNITIPAKMIDVNVHPTKKEIRLEKEKQVYEAVFNAISETLQKHHLAPKFSPVEMKAYDHKIPKSVVMDRSYQEKTGDFSRQQVLSSSSEKGTEQRSEEKQDLAASSKEPTSASFPPLKILDVIDKTYIVAKSYTSLYIIDQHAADERVNLEKFRQQHKNKAVAVQKLLEPIVLELSASKALLVKKSLALFSELGFSIEEFGANSFRLLTVPLVFNRMKDATLLHDLIDELEGTNTAKKMEEVKEKIIIMSACRSAIKAGDDMPFEYLHNVLQQLSRCEHPYSCAHGRPSIIELDIKDFEKSFHRCGYYGNKG